MFVDEVSPPRSARTQLQLNKLYVAIINHVYYSSLNNNHMFIAIIVSKLFHYSPFKLELLLSLNISLQVLQSIIKYIQCSYIIMIYNDIILLLDVLIISATYFAMLGWFVSWWPLAATPALQFGTKKCGFQSSGFFTRSVWMLFVIM